MAESLVIQFKVSQRANMRRVKEGERGFLKQPITANRKIYCFKCNWLHALPYFHNHTKSGLTIFQCFHSKSRELWTGTTVWQGWHATQLGLSSVAVTKTPAFQRLPTCPQRVGCRLCPLTMGSRLSSTLPVGHYCFHGRRNRENGGAIQWLWKLFLLCGTSDLSSHVTGRSRWHSYRSTAWEYITIPKAALMNTAINDG